MLPASHSSLTLPDVSHSTPVGLVALMPLTPVYCVSLVCTRTTAAVTYCGPFACFQTALTASRPIDCLPYGTASRTSACPLRHLTQV